MRASEQKNKPAAAEALDNRKSPREPDLVNDGFGPSVESPRQAEERARVGSLGIGRASESRSNPLIDNAEGDNVFAAIAPDPDVQRRLAENQARLSTKLSKLLAEGGHEALQKLRNANAISAEDEQRLGIPAGTRLHVAISENRSLEEVSKLLASGQLQNINARDRDGATPLHYAVSKKNAALVELLLDRGANINAIDGKGWTALHYAVTVQDTGIVKLLLTKGADKTIADSQGRTALTLAEANNSIFRLVYNSGWLSPRSSAGKAPAQQSFVERFSHPADDVNKQGNALCYLKDCIVPHYVDTARTKHASAADGARYITNAIMEAFTAEGAADLVNHPFTRAARFFTQDYLDMVEQNITGRDNNGRINSGFCKVKGIVNNLKGKLDKAFLDQWDPMEPKLLVASLRQGINEYYKTRIQQDQAPGERGSLGR